MRIQCLRTFGISAFAVLALIAAGCSQQAGVPFAGVTASPPASTNPQPKPEFVFPIAVEYGAGTNPSVAFASPTTVVEERQEIGSRLYVTVGAFANDSVTWHPSIFYQVGVKPAVAASGKTVVSVHQYAGNKLRYEVGHIDDDNYVRYGPPGDYDRGWNPKVALVGKTVVEVHEDRENQRLFYWVGEISGDKINWHGPVHYDNGFSPAVAFNSHGWLVEVHRDSDKELAVLHYRVGRIDSTKNVIDWSPSRIVSCSGPPDHAYGSSTSVALTDDGDVVTAFKGGPLRAGAVFSIIHTITGKLRGNPAEVSNADVDWFGAEHAPPNYYGTFDITPPSVAAYGTHAVVSAGGYINSVLLAASLLSDRANWMGDRLGYLGSRSLHQIVFPGTHDAGMYTSNNNPFNFGITQEQDIYGQLSGGVRWFDLRVNSDLRIFHGPIVGPSLSDVLGQIKKYMSERHREVVVLDFGVTPGDKGILAKFFDMGTAALGPWLYDNKTGKRLADISLNELMAGGHGIVIPLMNWNEKSTEHVGFYTKRNWDIGSKDNPGDPKLGQVTVFDQYSNTGTYETMAKGQLKKFEDFNGKMEVVDFPCDLFLLAWTLTPITFIASHAIIADAHLGPVMSHVNRNKFGLIPNIINTDFYEWSGSTDQAIAANERFSNNGRNF